MRIIEVIGSLQIGGAENQVVQLLNGWDSFFHEKHLVTFQSTNTHLSDRVGADVIRHHVPLRRWRQIGCIFRLARLFRKIRPHVVQSHMFHTNVYTVLAARLAGVPVVIATEHGKNLWKKSWHRWIERMIVSPLVTCRVAVSEDIRDIRVEAHEVPEAKIVVIPPCVPIPSDEGTYREGETIRIGAIGRMVEAKDYPTLIQAFASVIKSGVSAALIFLGDGPQRARLQDLAQEMLLSTCIHFPGFATDVGERLKTFDLVVFSSIREGIPVAMLEAMAAGIPIVATRVGGIPEVITDGMNGLLVESGSPEALAKAIARVAADPDLRKTLGRQGRQKVIALHSRESVCQRYENLFYKLLAEKNVDIQR